MFPKKLYSRVSLIKIASWAVRFGWRAAFSRFRVLPDYLIIGSQRCGTTSLYHYLTMHPGVVPAFGKEVHFFDLYYQYGLYWYRTYFPLAAQMNQLRRELHQQPITGEATPYYLFHPHAAGRVFKALPTAKLIVLLRNPVHRALSHYHHEVKAGFEQRSFQDAIQADLEQMDSVHQQFLNEGKNHNFQHMHHSYAARGVYVDQLVSWFEYFSREQFLILSSEAFYREPEKTLMAVYQFLGLPEIYPETFPVYNENQYLPMNSEIENMLVRYFEPHNQRLYALLDRDFGW